jgi:esterase/lipase superfamily enzyme
MKRFYFITNRDIDSLDFSKEKELSSDIHTGEFAIEPYFKQFRLVEKECKFYVGTVLERLNEVFDRVGKNVILFVHGFDTSFKESLVDCFKLYNNLNDDTDIVVLSWASNGKLNAKDYVEDRKDAEQSGQFISYIFRYLKNIGRETDLICHSMGTYVLRFGYQELRERGEVSRIFNNIVLVASDEDYDCFIKEYKLKDVDDLASRVFVFYNVDDLILRYSELAFRDNMARLGQVGMSSPDVNNKTKAIDVTEDIKRNEHGYLFSSNNPGFVKKLQGVFDSSI